MCRRLLLLVAAGALVVLALPPVAGSKATPKLNVSAKEFKFTLGKTAVKAGRTRITLANKGTEKHDLLLRKLNKAGKPVGAGIKLGPVLAGKSTSKNVTLKAGKYSLVCTIGEHASLGMSTRLVVRAS